MGRISYVRKQTTQEAPESAKKAGPHVHPFFGPKIRAKNDLMVRLMSDVQPGRLWAHRGEDGLACEKQPFIDFLSAAAGGPLYYRGRDRTMTHVGMGISDREIFAL